MGEDSISRHYDDDERKLASELMVEHYDQLIGIARSRRRRGAVGETMLTEDILHESLIKLGIDSDFNGSAHFMAAASLAIRHVIVDYARRKLADKRSAIQRRDDADIETLPEYSETPEELVALGNLMEKLETENPRWARITDARYFAGLTEEETANLLGVTSRTIRRDWTAAKQWLGERMAA